MDQQTDQDGLGRTWMDPGGPRPARTQADPDGPGRTRMDHDWLLLVPILADWLILANWPILADWLILAEWPLLANWLLLAD